MYAPLSHSPLPANGGEWGGDFLCLAIKCGPSGGAFAATPIFYRQIIYMDIYLMVFGSLCEKLFGLHCMCKRLCAENPIPFVNPEGGVGICNENLPWGWGI